MSLRSFATSLLLAAPLAACHTAPVANPRVTAVAKPAPAPVETPAPQPPAPIAPEVAAPIIEELIAEDPSCPMSVPETTVAFIETETGAALMFETSDVTEVRSRLDAIAFEHNKAGWTSDDGTVHASGGVQPIGEPTRLPVISTPSKATVETTGSGVRIDFAAEPGQLDRLRDEVRQQSIAMSGGRCSEPL